MSYLQIVFSRIQLQGSQVQAQHYNLCLTLQFPNPKVFSARPTLQPNLPMPSLFLVNPSLDSLYLIVHLLIYLVTLVHFFQLRLLYPLASLNNL